MKQSILIGCVADDFTGASDVASFLQQAGANCLLINGLPDENLNISDRYDAVVIALKIRSIDSETAVRLSLKGFDWLTKQGAQILYYKYCSTFDSTPKGSIGPILDALVERYQVPYTLLCPSLNVNGRTVKDGILYVEGIPLAETHMRKHPVNPMWDSFIPNLMKEQSQYPCFVIRREQWDNLDAILSTYKKTYQHFYLVPDFETDQDGKNIAKRFSRLRVYSGGSALPPLLYQHRTKSLATAVPANRNAPVNQTQRSIIISGSLSKMTRMQIDYYLEKGHKSLKLNPDWLIEGKQTLEEIWESVERYPEKDILIYSYPDSSASSKYSQATISKILEYTASQLGKKALEGNIQNIIVAGGETSGAVIKEMNNQLFDIGCPIAPGVPILHPVDHPNIKVALKSGNFGEASFFEKAINLMKTQ